MCALSLSHVQLFVTQWTAAHQVPLSMGILQARILEWVAMPSSRGYSQPKDQASSPALQVDSLLTEPSEKPILIYAYNVFLAALGLCCCMDFSLSAASGHYSLVLVHRLLVVVASHITEYGP